MTMHILVRTDRVAGDLVAAELEDAGYDVQVVPLAMPTFSGGMEWVQLWVPRDQRDGAMGVVEWMRQKYPNMPLDFTGTSETPPFGPA